MHLGKSLILQFSRDRFGRVFAGLILPALFCLGLLIFVKPVSAQVSDDVTQVPSRFRIGEKLSYNISFSKFANAGHAELHVVSRGQIGTLEAVEIRSSIKTLDLVSAVFFLLDESRTVFVSPYTGLPVYLSRTSHIGPIPKETFTSYLTVPTSNFDLVSLIYRAREAGGVGTFPFSENEQLYTAAFLNTGAERVRSDAGEFDTSISTVQSEFLTGLGIRDFKINFTTDEHCVPVLIRFKTAKGEFRALISAITLPEPETPVLPIPTPTPLTVAAPKPTPTPEVYIENKPLVPELGFQLGESLDYRITANGRAMGIITLHARERKIFEKDDSLLLAATVTGGQPGVNGLQAGNSIKAQVDPETLAPRWTESRVVSPFRALNQTVTFDKRTGAVAFGGPQTIDEPIGTHSILSLIYAMRSFNLKPSKDPSHPVNDTRVAVFWESKAYVFTLRPSNAEEITINGEKKSAQLITINTGNPELDALALKVWLSTEGRVPVRFSAGTYLAEIISQTSNLNK